MKLEEAMHRIDDCIIHKCEAYAGEEEAWRLIREALVANIKIAEMLNRANNIICRIGTTACGCDDVDAYQETREWLEDHLKII